MTSETGVPDFPALVELANRLKGKDRKTCELALYTLKKQDERLAKRDARIAELEAFRRDALKEVAELARERDALRDALKPFTNVDDIIPFFHDAGFGLFAHLVNKIDMEAARKILNME